MRGVTDIPERLHGRITIYCESPGCAAREIEIWVKDHGTETPITTLRCPVCDGAGRRKISVHSVQTFEQAMTVDAEWARHSVSQQMWERDHPDALVMNLGIFLRSSLPPTPDGWWD